MGASSKSQQSISRIQTFILIIITSVGISALLKRDEKQMTHQMSTASATPGGTSQPLPTLADKYERIFVLSEDLSNLPSNLDFDHQIALADVDTTFLMDAHPRLQALIISRDFLEYAASSSHSGAISTPTPGSTPVPGTALDALVTIIQGQHVLFVLDSSSNYIFQQLNLIGIVPWFDPGGEPVSGFDFESNDSIFYAGSGIHFQLDNPDVKWSVFESSVVRTANTEPTPVVAPGHTYMYPGQPDKPNYINVSQDIHDFIRDHVVEIGGFIIPPDCRKKGAVAIAFPRRDAKLRFQIKVVPHGGRRDWQVN